MSVHVAEETERFEDQTTGNLPDTEHYNADYKFVHLRCPNASGLPGSLPYAKPNTFCRRCYNVKLLDDY